MNILLTGGGTGGHFFPIIAVAEALNNLAEKEHLIDMNLYYMSDAPYDRALLAKNDITFIEAMAGKQRTYASIKNFSDKFKMLFGCIIATFKLFSLYPDVVFGKGGYASFPALFAARLLRIPVIIHESDIVPGRVNRWVGNYATKIALSYPEAASYFTHTERIALTGQPIRQELFSDITGDPAVALHLEPDLPVILVLGGSLGAERINEAIIDILPRLLEKCQVIHQTGAENIEWMKKRAEGALPNNPHASRYHPYAFIESPLLRLAAKASSLIISRAGSAIFEIALWEKPSILIPLPIARDDHQRKNAYGYARTEAATVVEETNLRPEIFYSVIESIMSNKAVQERMIAGTKSFVKPDAAQKIAQALLAIATAHN